MIEEIKKQIEEEYEKEQIFEFEDYDKYYRETELSMWDFMFELEELFYDNLQVVLYFSDESKRAMYCLTSDNYALSLFLFCNDYDVDHISLTTDLQLREFVIEALAFLLCGFEFVDIFEDVSEEDEEAIKEKSDEEVLLKFIERRYEDEFKKLKELFSEEELLHIAKEVLKSL